MAKQPLCPVRVDPALVAEVDKVAKKLRTTRSELIREGMRRVVENPPRENAGTR